MLAIMQEFEERMQFWEFQAVNSGYAQFSLSQDDRVPLDLQA